MVLRQIHGSSRSARNGFTIIELLVVIFIIVVLMALLLPAIQSVRAAARRTQSANNLRQIGIALQNYDSANGQFPPSWQAPSSSVGNNINGWSIHALLLPYIEEASLVTRIDYKRPYTEYTSKGTLGKVVTADGTETFLTAMRVPIYVSPDEPRDEVRLEDGKPTHYPLNYAANLGTFLVWDPKTGEKGNGAFTPENGLSSGAFRDGMSYTMAFAEVKAWQPYARNNGHEATNANIANITAAVTPDVDGRLNVAVDLADIEALVNGGDFKSSSGHTEWVDGRAHQIGFTTVFAPNTQVLVDVPGVGIVDVDWTNWREGTDLADGTGHATWAAVTARSYRSEGVLVLMMDGGTRLVGPNIDLGAWRAYSTRAGSEMIDSSEQIR